MYTSQDLAIRIKTIAKEKNTVIKDMLAELSLGSNTMSALYHGKSIAFDSLAKIADYLDCSVDYLLGRTDEPKVNAGNIIQTGNINGNNNANINPPALPLKTNTLELDEMETNLLNSFRQMEFAEKLELVSDVMKKAKKNNTVFNGINVT